MSQVAFLICAGICADVEACLRRLLSVWVVDGVALSSLATPAGDLLRCRGGRHTHGVGHVFNLASRRSSRRPNADPNDKVVFIRKRIDDAVVYAMPERPVLSAIGRQGIGGEDFA